jgi:hypothetical protein
MGNTHESRAEFCRETVGREDIVDSKLHGFYDEQTGEQIEGPVYGPAKPIRTIRAGSVCSASASRGVSLTSALPSHLHLMLPCQGFCMLAALQTFGTSLLSEKNHLQTRSTNPSSRDLRDGVQ